MKSIDEKVKEIMNRDDIQKLTNEEKKLMGLKIKKQLYDNILVEKGSLDAFILSIDPSSKDSSLPEFSGSSSNSSEGIFDNYRQSNDNMGLESPSEGSKTKCSSNDNVMESDGKNVDNIVNNILIKIRSFKGEERIQFCKKLLENLCF
jgi:hypothetical protein